MPTFEEVWAKKEALGYQYGDDALEQVRFGWQLRDELQNDRLQELQYLLKRFAATRSLSSMGEEGDIREAAEEALLCVARGER